MTHAMSLENRIKSNGVYGFISRKALRRWMVLAKEEMQHIRKGGKSIFRDYASTNIEEFLAVSVEVFFEQPNEFSNYNPELFQETCNLLNQYPV
jgi:Mlc titration factor MtfA (ptsG expression regulator)